MTPRISRSSRLRRLSANRVSEKSPRIYPNRDRSRNFNRDITRPIWICLRGSRLQGRARWSDLCVDRFVPKEWTGIQGFPPLDLQVKDDFPAFHKVRSRPINPRLYRHAKKEFERLTAYMYRHSTSTRAQGDQAVHPLLWRLQVAERVRAQDPGLYPSSPV